MPGAPFRPGDLVTLKTIEDEDVEFLRDGVNHPAVRGPVGQTTPTNGPAEQAAFEAESDDPDVVRLLITHDDERVGIIALDPIEWDHGVAEVGYWIAPEHRRQGYARDALDAVLAYAFDELRMHKVSASVYEFNVASDELLRSAGFSEEGVLRENVYADGRYHDTHWFGLLESEYRDG